jgi:Tfp pilus assembly protein PilF
MTILLIAIHDFVVDPKHAIDLSSLPTPEAISYIRKAYGFLASAINVSIQNGIIKIEYPEESEKEVEKALGFYERGLERANKGDYKGAIKLFRNALDIVPYHTVARRNLAMAYLELGEVEETRNQLIDVLRLDPKDAWGFLLLGNTYLKNDKDPDSAEPFYKSAYELTPNDPYLLNNYASLKADKRQFKEAQEMFERAIAENPNYPNSFVGLAYLFLLQEKLESAVSTLESLFAQPKSPDIRSEPVYDQARAMFRTVHQKIAERDHDVAMAFIEERKKVVESVTGFPVEIVLDDSLQGVTAKTHLAWKHDRDHHRIFYRENHPAVVPHLLAHELEHILLEHEARTADVNKLFVTTDATTEKAIESLGEERWKLRQSGVPAEEANRITRQWVSGLTNQLFNCPLDMVIEYRVHQKYPSLRSTQFVSLLATQVENAGVVTDQDIKKLVPKRIYQANVAMNASYAMFTDRLYGGATEYVKPYRETNIFGTGERLFKAWMDIKDELRAGDEYSLVDSFAKVLGLDSWFEFRDDRQMPESPQGTTNPELLRAKEPAIVMYLVAALERFEHMSIQDIQPIAFEIGLLGTTGIDFTKPDRRYSLKSLPNEQFSGLQLLALMYVGFKRIDGSVDTGLDFADAYKAALTLFKGRV